MKLRFGFALVLLTAMAACQTAPVTVHKPAATKAPVVTTEASPGASATPAARTLKRPAGDVHVLAGQVSVDAYYLKQTLGDAVKLGGPDGKTLILSNNGATIISEAGGSLISNNGGSILGKLKRKALDAPADLAIGDQRPVGGIMVSVVDISSGKPLALGQDDAGQPAYTVATNEAGGFEVYLPPKVDASTIRVSGAVAGSKDVRLAYDVFAGAEAPQVMVDEDSALVGRYLRSVFSAFVEQTATTLNNTAPSPTPTPPGFGGPFGGQGGFENPAGLDFILGGGKDKITATLKEAHSEAWTKAQLHAVADATSEALLARAKLDTIKAFSGSKLAVDELHDIVATARQKTTEAMRAGNDFHDEPWLVATNKDLPPDQQYVIKRPSDLLDYADREILASADRARQDQLQQVFAAIKMPGESYLDIFDAMVGINLAMLSMMQDDGSVDAVIAALRKGPPN